MGSAALLLIHVGERGNQYVFERSSNSSPARRNSRVGEVGERLRALLGLHGEA